MSIEALPALFDQLNALKQLPRTGWLLAGVAAPESIAEHTLATALVASLLADVINADWAAQGLAQPLDRAQVVWIALVHDLAECVVTDLPARATDALGRPVKHDAEARVLGQLFGQIDGGEAYTNGWRLYAEATTPEARVARDADKLEMVHQALRYERSGHPGLAEFWQGHTWHFPASAALFAALRRLRTPSDREGTTCEAA